MKRTRIKGVDTYGRGVFDTTIGAGGTAARGGGYDG